MIYLLPTSGPRDYRGVFPAHIRSISLGNAKDVDGAPCIHVETMCGDRYTIPRAELDYPKVNALRSFMGHSWMELLRSTARVEALTQERYDAWLAGIRAALADHYAERAKLQEYRRSQARSAFLRTRPTLSTNWMK